MKTLLDEALESWADARRGVVAELENTPARRFNFRPSPGARTVAELAQHIAESGYIGCGELTDRGGDFTRTDLAATAKGYADKVKRHRTKASLLRLLTASHQESERRLRRTGDLAMLQRLRGFDGQEWTRLSAMHRGVAHEEYHRAQLALYARLMGRTPALTKLIHGG